MTDQSHIVLWMDHSEAKIFHVSENGAQKIVVSSHATGRHLQHKANVTGSGHKGVDTAFFKEVIETFTGNGAILITGPGNAKSEFKNYMIEHRTDLGKRISAVETLDHPSDAELIALAPPALHSR